MPGAQAFDTNASTAVKPAKTMQTSLDRAERDVQEHSGALKKPLGLRDLVLTPGSGPPRNLDSRISSFGCSRFCFFTFRRLRS